MKAREAVRSQLRRHRLLAGDITQQELADRVGVTRQTIVAIEKGSYNPSVGLALKLGQALGAPVEQLFQISQGGSDE